MRCEGAARPRKRLGLTPLVDVVFLLLVFFMLANRPIEAPSLSVSLSHGDAAAPQNSETAEDLGEAAETQELVQLLIAADGGLTLANRPVVDQDLSGRLRALPHGSGNIALSLVPDPEVRLQRLVELLDVAAAAGIEGATLHRSFDE